MNLRTAPSVALLIATMAGPATAATYGLLIKGHAAQPDLRQFEALTRACAQQMGDDIRAFYAEQSDLHYQQQVRALIAARPDVAMIEPGWHDTGWALEQLSRAGIPMVTFRGSWQPETDNIHWWGDWSPDQREAGRLLAESLAARLPENTPREALALTGPHLDPVSLARQHGLHDADAQGVVKVREAVTAHWQETEAQRVISRAVQYFPSARIIWAANAAMAQGAAEAVSPRPDRSRFLIGGIGVTPWALEALDKGNLQVLVTGESLNGVNAVITAHRRLHQTNTPAPALAHWAVLTPETAPRIRQALAFPSPGSLRCRGLGQRSRQIPQPLSVLVDDTAQRDPAPVRTAGSAHPVAR